MLDLSTDLKSSQCVFFHQSSFSCPSLTKSYLYDQKTDTKMAPSFCLLSRVQVMEQKMGFILSNDGVALVNCGEERAELKGKALSLLVCLCSNPQRLSWGLDHDRKKEITSG